MIPILRFGVVGVIQNGISFLFVLLLLMLGLAPWQAIAIIFPIATMATYLANSLWTFDARSKNAAAPIAYALVYISAYMLSLLISYALELTGYPDWLVVITTVLLIAVYTFVLLNFVVFKK